MAVTSKAPSLYGRIQRWAYNMSGFNQYGLHHDDCLYETEDVQEALRRLPQSVKDERTFRMMRAIQLSSNKQILPKQEWTTWESDNRYLQPYLEEVIKERRDQEEWLKN